MGQVTYALRRLSALLAFLLGVLAGSLSSDDKFLAGPQPAALLDFELAQAAVKLNGKPLARDAAGWQSDGDRDSGDTATLHARSGPLSPAARETRSAAAVSLFASGRSPPYQPRAPPTV